MHATIRRYEGVDQNRSAELTSKVNETLVPKLENEQIYVAPRLGRMRISPHVYNDEADADRFVASLTRAMA